MGLSVAERGRALATWRWVNVRLMETLARWTPLTPEMEVKLVFGRHIWDFAQAADAFGRRTFELRMPAQHSLRPADAYAELIDDVARRDGTSARLAAFYDGLLPGLDARYAGYVAATDPILDGPSVLIVERQRQELARQRADADAVRNQLAIVAAGGDAVRARDAALADWIAPVVASASAAPAAS